MGEYFVYKVGTAAGSLGKIEIEEFKDKEWIKCIIKKETKNIKKFKETCNKIFQDVVMICYPSKSGIFANKEQLIVSISNGLEILKEEYEKLNDD